MDPKPGKKYCPCCDTILPASQFVIEGGSVPVISPYCITCTRPKLAAYKQRMHDLAAEREEQLVRAA